MHHWLIRRTNPDFVSYLASQTSLRPVVAQILINRGINSPEKARKFLHPDLAGISDPFALPGMSMAVERIRKAAAAAERVLVHGDYDADGVTATTIMVLALRQLGIQAEYFIPNRFTHGYGFNREAIARATGSGATLIVTVDCGINSYDEAEEARTQGIDVIVTDHHEPFVDDNGQFIVPQATAVVNPKLAPGEAEPLCGAGVAFKVAEALLGVEWARDLLDLAALGTVGDMVPLVGDNRVIVGHGLELMNSGARVSIDVLRSAAGIGDRVLTSNMLSFTIIPRINASGRIADAGDVVKFFLSNDREEASRLAQKLNANNAQRYRIEDTVFQEALALMNGRPLGSCVVLSSAQWHEGVIGIVASKIAETFNRPSIIFAVKDGVARGSARSTGTIDICRAISLCSAHVIRYGGHKQAAGLTVRPEQLADFERSIEEVLSRESGEGTRETPLMIDAEIALKDLTFPFLRELSRLEPFGFGNEQPLFAAKSLRVVEPRVVGRNHLKMKLKHNSSVLDAIGFDMGASCENLEWSGAVDAAFVPTINEWGGSRQLQLNLKALRPSA